MFSTLWNGQDELSEVLLFVACALGVLAAVSPRVKVFTAHASSLGWLSLALVALAFAVL